MVKKCLLILSLCLSTWLAADEIDQLQEPLYQPFIERYILDELKSVRQDQQQLRAEVSQQLAATQLSAADRAIRYTADTTNNIFYILTAAASLLVLVGWKSIRDIKDSIESTTSAKVTELTQEYENRLNGLEISLKERTDQIVAAQQEISDTNMVHSLWMRAGLEKSEQEKIKLYDQILEFKQNDVEALTYKADTLLDLDEDSWALSLANQALDQDEQYALAYWQRACANAKLEQPLAAMDDIRQALSLAPNLLEELNHERYFENLQNREDFQALLQEHV